MSTFLIMIYFGTDLDFIESLWMVYILMSPYPVPLFTPGITAVPLS